MKKIAALFFAFFAFALPLSADEFTDMVQALGVKAASVGIYDRAKISHDWDGKNTDRYTPQIWAERYAAEYGSIAGYRTFVGVCHNYTVCAYNDIQANQRKYNAAGMIEFYMISADTSVQVELEKVTTREKATVTYTSGTPVSRHGVRNVLTHKDFGANEKRASNHAWIWIQRDDGVWFWVDPTWTDFYGYVVWGYIANGEEVRLKPDTKFCVEWKKHLDDLPNPPPRGPKIQPAYVAQTEQPRPAAQQPSTSRPTSSYTPSTRPSYSRSYGYNHGISVGVSKPLGDFMSGNYIGSSFWDTIGGVSISYEDGNFYSLVGLFQLDYYHLDKKSLIFDFGLGKQLGTFFALYGGAGIGAGTTAEGIFDISLGNISFAWKAFAGMRFTFGRVALRADVSYIGDSGVVLGAFVGWMF